MNYKMYRHVQESHKCLTNSTVKIYLCTKLTHLLKSYNIFLHMPETSNINFVNEESYRPSWDQREREEQKN